MKKIFIMFMILSSLSFASRVKYFKIEYGESYEYFIKRLAEFCKDKKVIQISSHRGNSSYYYVVYEEEK